jgi:hypothetical protein
MPASGTAGTRVELRGTCPGIRYHRLVSVYFDHTLVAQFDGVGSQYAVAFSVPRRARPGPHRLTMRGGLITSADAVFEVTGDPPACEGDCNLDDSVTIDELVVGIRIALRHGDASACTAIDSNADGVVAIGELVQAVRAALLGCAPVPTCHDVFECEPPSSCLAPDGFVGCGICRPTETDCVRDADCTSRGPAHICAPVKPQDCPCEAVTVCQLGCRTDAECATGEACDAAHHCVPAPCTRGSCPSNFRCEERGTRFECHRIPCDRDSPAAFCVNGFLYDRLGSCTLPVP